MRDPKGKLITQYTMKGVEQDGHVKFDFLGLKTLDMIQGAIQIMQRRGVGIDLRAVGLHDTQTFEQIAKGETYSVFQFESSGMIDAIRQVKPDRFSDLVALVALYRPGPMGNIPQYARVKNGEEAASYQHPLMEPILKETNGIAVYQEQVMEVAKQLAGYSLGQADLLRRAMGKKIAKEMEAQQHIFCTGAEERGVPKALAAEIFEMLAKFADYGFNKSHAAAYAKISFQTAYLKRHHPEAFYASAMNLEIGKTDELAEFMYQAREAQIKVFGPDVNRSHAAFDLEDAKGQIVIRYGLSALRGVGSDAMARIVQHREETGRFTNLTDFVTRGLPLGLNKKMLESLVYAGALDSICPHRGAALAGIPTALKEADQTRQNVKVGQGLLFDMIAAAPKAAIADLTPDEKMDGELASLGFYFSGHPLTPIRSIMRRMKGMFALGSLLNGPEDALPNGKMTIKVPVVVMKKPEFRKTRTGKSMAILTVSDPTVMTEILLFDEKVGQFRQFMEKGKALLLEGRLSCENNQRRLWVDGIEPLPIEDMLRGLQDAPAMERFHVRPRKTAAERIAELNSRHAPPRDLPVEELYDPQDWTPPVVEETYVSDEIDVDA